MPRFPRLGRGEQDAPPEPHAAEQTQPEQQPQKLTSGDPLAAPAPDPETGAAAPPPHAVTTGDPLTGATSGEERPAAAPTAESPAPAAEVAHATESDESPTETAAETGSAETDEPASTTGAAEGEPAPTTGSAEGAPAPTTGSAEGAPASTTGSADTTAGAEPVAGGTVSEAVADPSGSAVGDAVLQPGPSSDAQPPAGDSPLWSAPGSGDGGATAADEAPTVVVPPDAAAAQPAGDGAEGAVVEQAPVDATPGFRERTRLRRRMRELRRMREIAFRDLGGLSFELHRFGRDRGDLVAAKLEALGRLDSELRAIEVALDARRPLIELREPGIAACPRCATLHGTDANFCPGCGTPLRGSVVGEAGPLRVTPVDNQPGAGS